jgi:ParB family chromosome partitioning protein
MAERRLGKGLGSLLPQPTADRPSETEIPIDRIHANPHQPRHRFEEKQLEELKESIRLHGVLQPIMVRRKGTEYEIILGERRWRAAKAVGKPVIPAIVREDVDDAAMLELALVENLQRADLDAIERATAFRAMMEDLQLTQDQVADRVGLSRSSVANHLRLLELPKAVQEALARGLLTMGHARALLGLANQEQMIRAMQAIARKELSVRDTEHLVRKLADPKRKPQTADPRTPWQNELEDRMRRFLGTKVSLQAGKDYSGTITIRFHNREDLDRIAEVLAPSVRI